MLELRQFLLFFSLGALFVTPSARAHVTPPLPNACLARVSCDWTEASGQVVLRQELDLKDGGGILREFRRDLTPSGGNRDRLRNERCALLKQEISQTPFCSAQWDENKVREERETRQIRDQVWDKIVLVALDFATLQRLGLYEDFPFPIVPSLPRALIQSWEDLEDVRLKNDSKYPYAYARFLDQMAKAKPRALMLDAVMYGNDPYVSTWLETSLRRIHEQNRYPFLAGTTEDESEVFHRHFRHVAVNLSVGFDSDGLEGRGYLSCDQKPQVSGWSMKVTTREGGARYHPFVYPYQCKAPSTFEVELARQGGYEIPKWKQQKTPLVYRTGEVTLGLHVPYMEQANAVPSYSLLQVTQPDFDLSTFDDKIVILGSMIDLTGVADAHIVEKKAMNGVMVILSATRAMLDPKIWESIHDTGMELNGAY